MLLNTWNDSWYSIREMGSGILQVNGQQEQKSCLLKRHNSQLVWEDKPSLLLLLHKVLEGNCIREGPEGRTDVPSTSVMFVKRSH